MVLGNIYPREDVLSYLCEETEYPNQCEEHEPFRVSGNHELCLHNDHTLPKNKKKKITPG